MPERPVVPERPAERLDGYGGPASLALEQWAREVEEVFGEHPYLVGSVARDWTQKRPRDLDVVVMLDDDIYAGWFGDHTANISMHGRLAALCSAFSAWGTERVGVPVDFKIQQQSKANERHGNEPRMPLGIYLGTTTGPPPAPVGAAPAPTDPRHDDFLSEDAEWEALAYRIGGLPFIHESDEVEALLEVIFDYRFRLVPEGYVVVPRGVVELDDGSRWEVLTVTPTSPVRASATVVADNARAREGHPWPSLRPLPVGDSPEGDENDG